MNSLYTKISVNIAAKIKCIKDSEKKESTNTKWVVEGSILSILQLLSDENCLSLHVFSNKRIIFDITPLFSVYLTKNAKGANLRARGFYQEKTDFEIDQVDTNRYKLKFADEYIYDFDTINKQKFEEAKESIISTRNKKTARINKSMFLVKEERELLLEFLANNARLLSDEKDLTVGEFFLSCFHLLKAIPAEIILAIIQEKQPNIEFIEAKKNDFNFSHLDKWRRLSKQGWEEKLKGKGTPQPISGRAVIMKAMDSYIRKMEIPTFSIFMKEILIVLGVFPENAIKAIRSHYRVIPENIDALLTTAQMKIKRARQLKNANIKMKKEKLKTPNPDNVLDLKKTTINALQTEQVYIDTFVKALKEHGITLASMLRYRIIATGIVKDVPIKKSTLKKCESFVYEPNQEVIGWDDALWGKKAAITQKLPRKNNNIGIPRISMHNFQEKLEKEGVVPAFWIRYNIFDYYGVYPKILGTTKLSPKEIEEETQKQATKMGVWQLTGTPKMKKFADIYSNAYKKWDS